MSFKKKRQSVGVQRTMTRYGLLSWRHRVPACVCRRNANLGSATIVTEHECVDLLTVLFF